MREIFATAARWIDSGNQFTFATLVELHRAKTAPLGTTIAVDSAGTIVGNIGAGCYENEIVEAALETAADGVTRRRDINLDLDDELLGGTACGAVMRIVVWRPMRDFMPIARAIGAGERAAELRVGDFACTIPAKAPLVLIGATTLAQALCALGRAADFRSVVIDPRPAFATCARLPDADEIVHAWPDDVLPEMLDVPALRSPAPYVGSPSVSWSGCAARSVWIWAAGRRLKRRFRS